MGRRGKEPSHVRVEGDARAPGRERRDAGGLVAALSIAERLARLDWRAIEHSLFEDGHARLPPLLGREECRAVAALWSDERRFRQHVDMARLRFGVGEYRYFANPLPPLVKELRTHAYRALAPVANRWMEALGRAERFPATARALAALCRRHGQTRPTPLILRYAEGGYNCLHQDLYGDVFFPFQLAVFLSRRDVDFEGGEFLLVENRPRAQSLGEAIAPEEGEAVVFPVAERPVRSRSGFFRARIRHGVSRLRRGERYTLGIIFHDAK